MVAGWVTVWSGVVAACLAAPHMPQPPSTSQHTSLLDGRLRGYASSGLGTPSKDQDVRDLEKLKPIGNLAVVKTHSAVFTNINGKQKEMAQTKEEVDKDGEMLARVEQQVDKSGLNGLPHIKTSLDIPSKNIHRVLETRPNPEDNEVDREKGPSGLQYSPADMAEYVFWTGDERGVTAAIEEYLQAGMMSREDAIDFLQEIKKNLEMLQTQFLDQALMKTQNKDRYDERSILNKKSTMEPLMGALDEDYEEMGERLRMSDLLYNEYSLQEIIYQLAKVMFTQSLSRGSVQAQDALQKVTGFLDSEAALGRITRGLEKKVLAVLISALSDTLTEHPELVSTARESLGVPQPLFQQFLSPEKPKSELGALMDEEKDEEGKGHRFQNGVSRQVKRTIQESGLKEHEGPRALPR